MSQAFERLIDKYAERRDFDRLTAFHAKRVEMLQQLQDGTYGAVVMTDLARQSGDMNAIIKFLLQSGQPAGTSKTYIYTLEKATTKADLKPDSCWDLKALQAEAAAK